MDVSLENLRITKELCLQYQQTHNKEIFEKIIGRVDNLVIYVALSFYYQYHFVERPDPQDLYQTGLLGLYKAIKTIKKQDEICFVPARIVFYVKSEILQSYTLEERERKVVESFCEKERSITDKEIFDKIESEDIQKIFNNLISKKVITQKDYELLVLRFVEEISVHEIVKMGIYGKSWAGVDKKIQKIVGRIKNVINQDLREDLGD